MLNSTIVSYRS